MASEAYHQACSLFVDEQYEEALRSFTTAIELGATSPQLSEYLVKRSACHHKLKNYTQAVEDVNRAIDLDPKNAKAYFRKGVACFSLDEFETAKKAFEKGQELDPSDANFKLWIRKCDAEIATEDAGDASAQTDIKHEPTFATAQVQSKAEPSHPPPPSQPSEQPPQPQAEPTPKIRHTWYQNDAYVYVTFYVKNMREEDVKVDFEESSLVVRLNLPEGETFTFNSTLCDSILPGECRKSIGKTNIEIRLKKAKILQWASLEKIASEKPLLNPWPDTSSANKHLYPSSSKVKRDWDKIAAEVAEEKPEGEAALNKVFQDIYGSGSEEQRRAMIKSFTESGGTVLSTNWDEVGKAPVKVHLLKDLT